MNDAWAVHLAGAYRCWVKRSVSLLRGAYTTRTTTYKQRLRLISKDQRMKVREHHLLDDALPHHVLNEPRHILQHTLVRPPNLTFDVSVRKQPLPYRKRLPAPLPSPRIVESSQLVSEDAPDPHTRAMIMGLATNSLFSGHFTYRAIDTELLNRNTRSDLSTFVAKGRFPLFVRYDSPATKIFLFVEIPLPKY